MLMLSSPQRDLVRDHGTKLGRILIGFLFFAAGLGMLFIQGPDNVGLYFDSIGIPFAGFFVWVVIILKITAGAAIMIGKRVGLASASLIGFTIIATLVAHGNFSDPAQFTQALKNLAIVGGLLYLLSYGPGGTYTGRLAPTEEDKDGDGVSDITLN